MIRFVSPSVIVLFSSMLKVNLLFTLNLISDDIRSPFLCRWRPSTISSSPIIFSICFFKFSNLMVLFSSSNVTFFMQSHGQMSLFSCGCTYGIGPNIDLLNFILFFMIELKTFGCNKSNLLFSLF